MRVEKSQALYRDAKRLIPGGVNTPIEAFRGVGRDPRFVAGGSGSRIWDVDGNEYIDYVLSWGSLILGHADRRVVEAVCDAAGDGLCFAAPTERETVLARIIAEALPSVEMVRVVASAAEAMMSAIRLARAYTRKTKVVKFAGCYHGHIDTLLVKADPASSALGGQGTPGVPDSHVADTFVVPYNDLDSVEVVVKSQHREIACIIVEPVASNIGVVAPAEGFLQGLRALCDKYGILLIFDEVLTGFRVAWGGAETLYGVKPDMTCLGKIIGGGLPIGAYGGSRELMDMLQPVGECYQAGVLAASPLAVTAGIVTLDVLRDPSTYSTLEGISAKLADGLVSAAAAAGVPLQVNRVGSMMTPFFSDAPVTELSSADACSEDSFKRYFGYMIENGIYIPPSALAPMFVSLAHSDEDIDKTLDVASAAFAAVARPAGKARA